jgi:purine-binding chemotaxis protein CheW
MPGAGRTTPPVDWARLRERLAEARARLEQSERASPERKREILKQRARLLARAPNEDTGKREALDLVEFTLSQTRYGIDCDIIAEVAPLREYAPLPFAPSFVLGICALRGKLVSIFDLRGLLGLPGAGITDLNRVILLTREGRSFGIIADAVQSVVRIYEDELAPPLATQAQGRLNFCRGISKRGLLVLDTERLMAAGELGGEAEDTERGLPGAPTAVRALK